MAKNWKTEEVPTVFEWWVRCQYLLLMNKLTAIKTVRNASEIALTSCFNIGSGFINYWHRVCPRNNIDISFYLFMTPYSPAI